MTSTYDPHHPGYLDEAGVRSELTRVFDICHACRRCVALCTSFPTLFDMIDRVEDHDAGRLTPAEQDRVVDECVQCKLCHVTCPYTPDVHEWSVDFPRLMMRADAMRHATGQGPVLERAASNMRARTDLIGRAGTALAKIGGASLVRLLRPFATQRFSTWFDKRARAARRRPPEAVQVGSRSAVTVFPTCVVEYREPHIGNDLVKVYEHNGIGCTTTAAGCCGAPWLDAGDIEQFTKVARRNVAALADEVRAGTEIVVPQPICSYVLKHEYARYVEGSDAELVAAHTFDAAEYLMNVHADDHTRLDTEFRGDVPATVTYRWPSHLRAQGIGPTSQALMELTGAEVTLVEPCPATEPLDSITSSGNEVVAGDCHRANTAFAERTGRHVVHPIQVVARAYGLPEE
jgi:glycerol-3-phosphate dehydrogenase subunit C